MSSLEVTFSAIRTLVISGSRGSCNMCRPRSKCWTQVEVMELLVTSCRFSFKWQVNILSSNMMVLTTTNTEVLTKNYNSYFFEGDHQSFNVLSWFKYGKCSFVPDYIFLDKIDLSMSGVNWTQAKLLFRNFLKTSNWQRLRSDHWQTNCHCW